ncbi:unnamed protein product [Dovyalis caffra]|uniref:GIY-YIG domain-containing protein n=1 Tax=Dovyalis caffra TaxID=77055 RepID=A0AAV1R8Y0_9ROSI|nr:unnamed protein product [Dovyalis caffra]
MVSDLPYFLKQHNGELKGGAKASRAGRPWICACIIHGFNDQSEACEFESKWKSFSKTLPRKRIDGDQMKQSSQDSHRLLQHRKTALDRVEVIALFVDNIAYHSYHDLIIDIDRSKDVRGKVMKLPGCAFQIIIVSNNIKIVYGCGSNRSSQLSRFKAVEEKGICEVPILIFDSCWDFKAGLPFIVNQLTLLRLRLHTFSSSYVLLL